MVDGWVAPLDGKERWMSPTVGWMADPTGMGGRRHDSRFLDRQEWGTRVEEQVDEQSNTCNHVNIRMM